MVARHVTKPKRTRCTTEGCRRYSTDGTGHCPDHTDEPAQPGRPTKLTRELLDTLELIADDQWSIRDACMAIGIGETTWRRWEADPTPDPDPLLVEFRALAARVRVGSGDKIEGAAWGVLREVLEDDKAPRAERITAATNALRLRTAHRVEVSGPDGGPIPTGKPDLSKLSEEELLELHRLTAKAHTPEEDA